MLIDWFTVGAQAFNFLVLMVLLKVLLYDRVIKAMAKREASIKERLDQGRGKMEEARALKREYEAKDQELEQRRREVLGQAKDEAQAKREEILSQAQGEARELGERWKEGVRRERDAFLDQISRDVGDKALDLARQVLADLADAKLEQAVAEKFLALLDGLGKDEERDLNAAMQEGQDPVLVKSAREMGADLRSRITGRLRQWGEAEVEYRVDTDLVLGVVVVAGGRTLGYNVREYLEDVRLTLEQSLARGAGDEQGEDGGHE